MKKEIELPSYLLQRPWTEDDFDEYIIELKDFINDTRKNDIKNLLRWVSVKRSKIRTYEYSRAFDDIYRYLKNLIKKLSE